MDNETERRARLVNNEQRGIKFAREYELEQHRKREDAAREALQKSEKFQRLLAADREMDNDHLKQLAIAAGAKIIADDPRKYEELGLVAELAKAKAFEQERLERQQAIERENATRATTVPQRERFSTDPRRQWLGKYAELERLSQRSNRDDPAEDIARRQREESDRRQSLMPGARSDVRKPTENDREARIEQTDRRRERSASTREVTDDRAKRREAILRKFGHEPDDTGRDGPEGGRGRER